MEIEWSIAGARYRCRVDAHVEPYVRAIGVDETVKFLLNFGGAELYVGRRTRSCGSLAQVMGKDIAERLYEALNDISGSGHINVPLGNGFIARALRSQGKSVAEIARTMHSSEVVVRGRYLRTGPSLRCLSNAPVNLPRSATMPPFSNKEEATDE